MRDGLKIDHHPRDCPRAAAMPGPYCLAKLNQPLVWTCTDMQQLLEGKSGPDFDSCHLDPTPLALAYDAEPGLYSFL
jgi:hypothetical protein